MAERLSSGLDFPCVENCSAKCPIGDTDCFIDCVNKECGGNLPKFDDLLRVVLLATVGNRYDIRPRDQAKGA